MAIMENNVPIRSRTERKALLSFFIQSTLIILFLLFMSVSENPTKAAETNLVVNPSFETQNPSDATAPSNWIRGNWGSNTAVFSYPVAGQDGVRAARVQITSRATGDAKWASEHISVVPGTEYRYVDYYKSNATTELVIEYSSTSGGMSYVSLGMIPAASTWTVVSRGFIIPSGITSVRVFHLLGRVGTLTIDNISLSVAGNSS